MMRKVFWGVVVVVAVAVGVVRIVRAVEGQQVYVYADQVAGDSARWQGKNIAVRGSVEAGSRRRDAGAAEWRFNVVSRGETLRVRYSGVIPSTFVDAAEVVVVGRVRDGELDARNLLVRVPG